MQHCVLNWIYLLYSRSFTCSFSCLLLIVKTGTVNVDNFNFMAFRNIKFEFYTNSSMSNKTVAKVLMILNHCIRCKTRCLLHNSASFTYVKICTYPKLYMNTFQHISNLHFFILSVFHCYTIIVCEK